MPIFSTGPVHTLPDCWNLKAPLGDFVSKSTRAVDILEWVIKMGKNTWSVLYLIVMIAAIVSVDLLFFRHHLWQRLMVNIGIVLVFIAFYLRFLNKP